MSFGSRRLFVTGVRIVKMQVLTSEGLLRYVDSRCVQRELSEVAGGISQQQMDEAAHELLYMRQEDAPARTTIAQTTPETIQTFTQTTHTPATQRPPYYEHLGGYGMHELHDFNQYSASSSAAVTSRPAAVATTSASGSGVWWWWQKRRRHRPAESHSAAPPPSQSQTGTADETTMYITSV